MDDLPPFEALIGRNPSVSLSGDIRRRKRVPAPNHDLEVAVMDVVLLLLRAIVFLPLQRTGANTEET